MHDRALPVSDNDWGSSDIACCFITPDINFSCIICFGTILSIKYSHEICSKDFEKKYQHQRTNGPVNAHLISWPSKAQNIQNLENIW